jgi:hypothetical protein
MDGDGPAGADLEVEPEYPVDQERRQDGDLVMPRDPPIDARIWVKVIAPPSVLTRTTEPRILAGVGE